MKNLKWVLLKNESKLTKQEKELINRVFSKPAYILLKKTYESKNKFRAILQEDISRDQAEKKVKEWLIEIAGMTNRFLNQFVAFYNRWQEYILNYFEGRYHTSLIEGINNKIKSIKRRAFGFANFEFFKLRVITAFM